MKLSVISKSLLPALALLLATTAFAANKGNKGSFEVVDPVTVSGHQLAPGQYKLTWDGTGSSVELMILVAREAGGDGTGSFDRTESIRT